MLSRPGILLLAGVSILGIAAIAAQTTFSPYTVRGELTARDKGYAESVACDQTKVSAEVWFLLPNPIASLLPLPRFAVSSTSAQGSTVGQGCTYTLAANYSPLLELLPFSSYRISASTPVKSNGEDSGGYTKAVSPPYPEQLDMKF